MPPSDPIFVNVSADVWTPVAVDGVSVAVNILEAFADLVYYQTYRLTGQPAPDNTANPGDVDFEGIAIFNRRDRIAGKDVFVGGVEFQTSAGIDVYIYALGKAGKVRVDSLAIGDGGDIEIIAWTDYGGISTITGFSSVTTKAIWYKKVGKLVFVNYVIFGLSNAINFTFTLPFSSSNSTQYITRNAAQVRNNGTVQANSGHAKLPQNSNIVTLYLDWAESAFSAAGGKGAEGQFWYETT